MEKYTFSVIKLKRPAPDSELSICFISLAISNKHDLRQKKTKKKKTQEHFMQFKI